MQSSALDSNPTANNLDDYLRASVHKEHRGMLLPRLDIMRFVDHSVELHICLTAEVKDLGWDVIWGTTCGESSDTSDAVTAPGSASYPGEQAHSAQT